MFFLCLGVIGKLLCIVWSFVSPVVDRYTRIEPITVDIMNFYHEPSAREIGQPIPVYLTVNKLYLYLYYIEITLHIIFISIANKVNLHAFFLFVNLCHFNIVEIVVVFWLFFHSTRLWLLNLVNKTFGWSFWTSRHLQFWSYQASAIV